MLRGEIGRLGALGPGWIGGDSGWIGGDSGWIGGEIGRLGALGTDGV